MTSPLEQPGARPTYSHTQILGLYNRINLPSRLRYQPGDFSKEVVRHQDGHGFLFGLTRHMLAAVPFENLGLHYSTQQQISIDPYDLYEKIVLQGRGGYGLENNTFFGHVLSSVGYEVRSVGARVNNAQQVHHHSNHAEIIVFGGWSHMVNLVTIRDETFMVDVGFGYGGPVHALQLSPEKDGSIVNNIAPQQSVRLRRGSIPGTEREGLRNNLWIFERRDSSTGSWAPVYCFSDDVDFLPQDFEIMNFFAGTNRRSIFTHTVICSKFVLNKSQDEIVYAMVLSGDRMWRCDGGSREQVGDFETEEGRIDTLAKYFDIKLSNAQKAGILGMVTALA